MSLDGRSPLRPALIMIGVVMLVLGAADVGLAFAGPAALVLSSLLYTLVGEVYVGSGLVAWSRRPSNRLGPIMVAGGFVIIVGDLVNTQDAVLIAAGTVVATVPIAVVVHLAHAFPSGRIASVGSRWVVIAGYGVCLVLQVPLYLFTAAPEPYHLLGVADRPDLAEAAATVQTIAGSAVLMATTVILLGRWRRATPSQRRVLAPLYAYAILAVPLIPLLPNVVQPLLGLSDDTTNGLQLVVLAGIPVAFAFAVLRGGFARTGQIEELAAWLGTSDDARPELTTALARTVGDDSLSLMFWVPEYDEYVDAAGRRVQLPPAGTGRAAVEVELGGRRIGAIGYDATLIADPDEVRAAGRVVAIALDRERLTAELLASRDALKDSRARIVEAGDRERSRIAQNLHDGLQVRLVLLAMDAQLIADDLDATATTQRAAKELRTRIDEAAAQLRATVHAVMPAELAGAGLSAATEDLVDRVPVPTRLELAISGTSLPPAIESTAYFLVAEALANALKHSGAREISVRVVTVDGQLHVEVDDDGMGGASPLRGTGLHGLADRVDTVGGRLRIDSPPGCGTRIVAELPCG